MELLLLLLGGLLVLFGFIGSFLPIVPGLPISLLGILIMQWTLAPFSSAFIWGWTFAIILFSIVELISPSAVASYKVFLSIQRDVILLLLLCLVLIL